MAWIGVAAPAGTPPAIVRRVNAEIEKALTTPEVKSRLTQLAFAPVGGSPENFTQFIEAEVAAWAKIVKDSGTKLE
jgi:tripartite-type tricarboxylate transporter receptor subunit TctC